VGRKYRPLTCKEVKRILRSLGFEFQRQKGSHEHWKAVVKGKMRLVTVDCPKEPFVAPLLTLMVEQSGYSKDEWYQQLPKR
jgi:predicted RNA binding protein YcfA (HicA-like mRNA interferase family)